MRGLGAPFAGVSFLGSVERCCVWARVGLFVLLMVVMVFAGLAGFGVF